MASKVIVLIKGSKRGHVFEGDFDAGVTPANALVVSELVPDVANKNKGNPIPQVRTIYNSRHWQQVILNDGVAQVPAEDDDDEEDNDFS